MIVDTAMVMAAGLGKRMRPLTATRPKPLVQVAGTTLLDHTLDHLRDAGVRRVVVNVHYLADAVEAHLARRAADLDILVSDERAELLETGGGTVKALPLLDREHFFSINSDNWWVDGPTPWHQLLTDRWDDAQMDALLLVVPYARATCHGGPGDFHLDAAGKVSRRRPARVAPYVWTGIQLLSRRFFDDPPPGRFSTNILWDRAIERGRLFGVVHSGLWFDVGTPPAVKKTEALLASE
ncbi:nucleotidyltransferase family protein [Bradyrhizobium sp.]|uniref:nucleotidyltransferase family protein n=1 Tax=Bradyrhizobium sp. TaxID=376 RepID=UPI0025BBD3C2|nr:nucleotidyltransferase family protein [Bradyrhizobium sp.]MCA3255009.1 nucleotidyltransferase family protein [Alphaproteobacteria bacterium]MCA3569022.1 nucleotidyltransferase family protein [Bradyrhizobium sp.]